MLVLARDISASISRRVGTCERKLLSVIVAVLSASTERTRATNRDKRSRSTSALPFTALQRDNALRRRQKYKIAVGLPV